MEIDWKINAEGNLRHTGIKDSVEIHIDNSSFTEYSYDLLIFANGEETSYSSIDEAKAAVPGEIMKVIEALDNLLPDNKWDATDKAFSKIIERLCKQAKVEVLEELLATVERGVWTYEQIEDRIAELREKL